MRAAALARQLAMYRSGNTTDTDESRTDSTEFEDAVCPPGCKPAKRKRDTPSTFSVAQVDTALDLMTINGLSELERADFTVFGRKLSWAHLAQGCLRRLAADTLQMSRDLRAVSERADLLHNRLNARRSQKIRTPQNIQDGIDSLYAVTQTIRELLRLRDGVMVADVQKTLGRATGLRRRFLELSPLNPDIRPRTNDLEALIKSAFEAVLRANVSEGTKALARRNMAQWTKCSEPRGERITWDSDDDLLSCTS